MPPLILVAMPTSYLTSPATAAHLTLAGMRVVVIDDDHSFRALVDYHLRRFGAETELFEGGLEAIKRIDIPVEQSAGLPTIDAVVVDLRMPQIDGYATAMRLRSAGYLGRIIALSASADEESRQLCAHAGGDKLLAKPFDPEDLLWAILGAEPL